MATGWRLEMGANVEGDGVRFRVWAPEAHQVQVLVDDNAHPLEREPHGTWTALVPGIGAGARYAYLVDGGELRLPDPCSRYQPDGVHGLSEVVDPSTFRWTDADWQGVSREGLVIYECHVGTATPEGTFDALVGQVDRLLRLGVTALQLMPVAEFSGTRNWGYDGVDLYAPSRSYGGPDGLRRLVDAAHAKGLAVFLDVVYNHLGPEGNYLRQFATQYFTDRYHTPWGDAVNLDAAGSAWVRRFIQDNVLSWLHEYHLDGLRFDATNELYDASPTHLLQQISQAARASVAPRRVVLIAETSENDVRYLKAPEEGGHGFDGVWTDDFHHAVRSYVAGDRESYYQDYSGTLADVARCIQQGFLFEGQMSPFMGQPRGTQAREQPASQFVYHIQNHDQVGNRAFGDRLHHTLDLDRFKVASALLAWVPQTPMLFMGQEFASSSPFQYFTDHSGDLGRLVTEGRRREFAGFSAFGAENATAAVPDPQADETFQRSKLDLGEMERKPGAGVYRLHEALYALRREDAVLRRQDRQATKPLTCGKDLLVLDVQHAGERRLALFNFGEQWSGPLRDLAGDSAPTGWRPVLSTDEERFGGSGAAVALAGVLLTVPARTAVLLASGEER